MGPLFFSTEKKMGPLFSPLEKMSPLFFSTGEDGSSAFVFFFFLEIILFKWVIIIR